MIFMASNVKCFMKAVAVVALAGICVLGGYSYAMKYQANSILSALPRPMEDSEIDDTYTPGEDDQEVTVIAQNDISAASEGSWNTVDSYMYDITGDGVNDNITLYSSSHAAGSQNAPNEQNWILEVSDGVKGYYTLLDSSLLHSTVYYDVVEKTSKRKAIIVYETTETGTDIVEYIFTEKGFEEAVTYSSNSSAKVHSSVPMYEQ